MNITFLCSSANSARRTFIMSNFLKSRKLVSMFLIFAIISSNFGLNSRKIWLYLPKNGENFACLEQKNAHYADWIKYQIFCNFGSIFFSARFLRILSLTLYCSQTQFLKTKVIIVSHDGLLCRSVALSNYVTKLGTHI